MKNSFVKILNFLVKPEQNIVRKRLEREEIVMKQWNFIGIALTALLSLIFITLAMVFFMSEKDPPITYQADLKNQEAKEIIVLPFPHQSFDNLTSWIKESVSNIYSFDFINFDDQVRKSRYYFTGSGYDTYLNDILEKKVRDRVISDQLQVTLVPISEPILINDGVIGNTEFWRFRVRVMISYFAGSITVNERNDLDLLILRVPAYENHKGLSIAEFNLTYAS